MTPENRNQRRNVYEYKVKKPVGGINFFLMGNEVNEYPNIE